MPGAPAMNVPIPRRGGQAPAAGGLQTEETLLPRARSWSGRRTTLLANSPSAGVALGPLVSPSFSGRGFIRQSPSVTSTSPAFSPPPFDLARNSLPTIISVGNLAAVASGAADISGRTRSGLVSASSSPRESESPPATPGVERDPLGGAQDPRNQQQQAVDQSLEAPLLTDKGDHPADSPTEPPPPASQPGAESTNSVLKCAIFGAINAIVAVPCMIAYAAIIFADPFFHPFKGQLIKLVLFSSVIHQACFSAQSSLPFAIGQVQDAGLIFLSQMAKSIVVSCKAASLPDEEIIATTLVGLGCCTAALGASLWITGRLQLADAVQYLPLPVIGGYLAFIGLYCFEAALSLMTGLELTGLLSLTDAHTEWHELTTLRNLWLTLPGILCGIALLLMVVRVRHYLALPLSLMAIPVGFYAVLLCTELNLEHLADTNSTQGWIAPLPTETPPPFYEVWSLFRSRIHWSALPALFPTWLGMFFVVAFGSCLDVAAISLDMGQRLDYNHELKVVGISNLVSGLLGGYTGSYIFSLTTFTYRSATDSRMVGGILCAAELLLFVLPINIAAYLPHFFFGAVLVFIAIDLLLDWLVHSFHKVSIAEYAIIWCTFLAISFVGLQEGMGIGLSISVVQFVLSYARVRKAKPVSKGSGVMRGFHSRSLLAQTQEAIAVFQLQGYIFFGSVVQIVADIESHVRVAASTGRSEGTADLERASANSSLSTSPITDESPPTAYVVIDMHAVNGVDATAARSCFLALVQMLRPHGIPLCLAHVTPALERLLRSHDVISDDRPDECRCFASTSEAVEWCESNILLEQGILSPSVDTHTRPRLKSSVQVGAMAAGYSPRVGAMDSSARSSAIAGLQHILVQFAGAGPPSARVSASWVHVAGRYFQTKQIASGSSIFRAGDAADCIYVLESGSVTLLNALSADGRRQQQRLLRYSNGGIFGELDFFLGQARSFDAVAGSDCALHVLQRESYARLIEEEPVVGAALQSALLKHLCLETQTVLRSSVL